MLPATGPSPDHKQTAWVPAYMELYTSGELEQRVKQAYRMLESCTVCPRRCGVNRLAGETGFCRAGAEPVVASWNVHHWEEPPISGTRGSGTIFLSYCTARCLFCQNYPISQLGVGQRVSTKRLAEMMLELQARGCHNINWVTPTHFVPQILQALALAIPQGFRLPLVYNSSGYDAVETLRLLDGVVDIYLPDAKYADNRIALELSGYPDYVEVNRQALKQIHRQVGSELVLDEYGIALRGMIIRHLVLPGGLSGTDQVLRWIADELSPLVYVSLMSQYFPAHKAFEHPILRRKISEEEYIAALEAFGAAGLEEGWRQGASEEEA